ncbi:MAG: hypothetical protein QXL51_06240 [Candidatus Aenigmatarchaeota archaeon]
MSEVLKSNVTYSYYVYTLRFQRLDFSTGYIKVRSYVTLTEDQLKERVRNILKENTEQYQELQPTLIPVSLVSIQKYNVVEGKREEISKEFPYKDFLIDLSEEQPPPPPPKPKPRPRRKPKHKRVKHKAKRKSKAKRKYKRKKAKRKPKRRIYKRKVRRYRKRRR